MKREVYFLVFGFVCLIIGLITGGLIQSNFSNSILNQERALCEQQKFDIQYIHNVAQADCELEIRKQVGFYGDTIKALQQLNQQCERENTQLLFECTTMCIDSIAQYVSNNSLQ
jgi:hypothetical protein